MSHRLALVTLVLFSVIFVSEGGRASKDHYPLYWSRVNTKEIIDHDRLFAKYKECLVKKHAQACPVLVVDFKKSLQEMFDTNCAKCLPSHKQAFKTMIEYVCHRRRADFEEIRRDFDPDGKYWKQSQDVLGKLDC